MTAGGTIRRGDPVTLRVIAGECRTANGSSGAPRRTRHPFGLMRGVHPRGPCRVSAKPRQQIDRGGALAIANLDDDLPMRLCLPLDRDNAALLLDAALDESRTRFGKTAVTRAVLLERGYDLSMPLIPD